VVVFDGVAGVEAQSEAVWRQADRYMVPRICLINKMDRLGANFDRTVSMIRERLKANPLPVQLPLGAEESYQGVIDLIENKAWSFDGSPDAEPVEVPIPEADRAKVIKYRQLLIEKLAELDDDIMVAYIEGDDDIMVAYIEGDGITADKLRQVLRRATLASKVVPVLCGSALKNKGVRLLLTAIVNYLPSPMDVLAVIGHETKSGNEVTRPPSDDAPFSALAFKVVSDPFVGRLVYLRVYSGRVKSGAQVYNSTRDERERLGRILLMHANRREELDEAGAGDIIASLGLRHTFTGDTLCPATDQVLFENIVFTEPVMSIAIEPKTRADQEKMDSALQRLTEEDPTFKVNYNKETGQLVISGMGELHLEILVDRMLSEFGVAAKVGRPQVAYKETVSAPAQSQGKFVRQSGGRGQYGHVYLKIEPLERGAGFQFVDKVKGGALPKEYVIAAGAGIKEAMESGVLAGYPVVDIKATVYDGSYHEVDSSPLAFKMAGSMALKEAIRRGRPVLLEPIMRLEVVAPGECMGDVIGDLTARRGHIEAIETRYVGMAIIHCLVPLAETFGYATSLRSITQGRATYSLEPCRYQELPFEATEKHIKQNLGKTLSRSS